MRTTRAIFFLVHHEPKKHSSCLKNGLKCCIPKKNGTEKENRTSIRMTVRVERWGGIIDDDRDRYANYVPAIPHSRARAACCRLFPLRSSDGIFAESSDRQNSRSSSLSSIVLAWRAVTSERPTGREGGHGISVEFKLTATVVNTPQFAVQQCAAACCDIACCDIFHCNSLQYGTGL